MLWYQFEASSTFEAALETSTLFVLHCSICILHIYIIAHNVFQSTPNPRRIASTKSHSGVSPCASHMLTPRMPA